MPSSGDGHGWVMEAVDLYELPLLRYARRLVDDLDLAADAVQHAFLKLCEESQERLDGRVAPWLFRVCRNRALDHLRHSGRERSLLDADDGGTTPGRGPTASRVPDGRTADPAASAEQADLAGRLRELLADLPAPQRETIDLWCEGLTYRQIAEITGRQEGHVRVLAHRGLSALRAHPLVRGLLTDDSARGGPAAQP